MNLTLLAIGKTDNAELEILVKEYENRLGHYIKFEFKALPDIKNTKNLSIERQKQKEGVLLLKSLSPTDVLVLFDERGKQFSSKEFAHELQKRMNSGIKNLVFVIGGPYGFSKEVHLRANQKISLSKLTFSHQMVRLFVVEQLYRAFTILRNEPYHHD